jgi:hypothetical protein
MRRAVLQIVVTAAAMLAACDHRYREPHVGVPSSRPVSILVEVFDPATNFVWENVGVRVVEADQEWSGCTCQNPNVDWFFTDSTGQVLIDEFVLADSGVGFLEDRNRAAVLGARSFEDEAVVVLEIDALGFSPVTVEVSLSWDVPDVFVEVPFD